MSDVIIAISLLWGFIFIYAVMATMDFGAGFWSMVYINKEKTNATNIANRYLSPTWEVTNVFIVAIVVAVISFFPGATFTLGTVLLLPGSVILLLLAVRSGFLVFSHIAEEYRKPLTYISGITGFLIPGLLIIILPVTHGNFIEVRDGVEQLLVGELLTSFHAWTFFGFAVSSTLFLSSLLLADFSNHADEQEAYHIYRRDALILGPITLTMALLVMVTMRYEAVWLYEGMMEHLPFLLASAGAFFLAGFFLLMPTGQGKRGWPRLAVIVIVLQYLLASYAYGRAHLPYLIYPSITIEDGFTNPEAFRALFITYIVGFAILFPGFIYFWRLFMKDKRYAKQQKSNYDKK
ncbi:cytochrome d ubiquinol oxidase subunit II [Sediminibacillus albus]|uniref:Cytochrome d ubiquinol oxidase subunit II n=1 Tax=Sediminibacillus albus TaxID=407036 RepID=A0A1G8WET0_9BACI|nr:cytochrome d ubiquinol oxidase subunit II [Sediminibacillus albus]SDJ76666.1 cytochrome d ubiquinol oxidase subunit II [Sediminibacillus albus]